MRLLGGILLAVGALGFFITMMVLAFSGESAEEPYGTIVEITEERVEGGRMEGTETRRSEMSRVAQLRTRRERLLAELSELDQVRRGSVVKQYVEAVHKDGTKVRRGPYWLYSYKEQGKTESRRIKAPHEVKKYRRQIEAFRRFERIMRDLVRVGEELSDVALAGEDAVVKKTPRSSSSGTKR